MKIERLVLGVWDIANEISDPLVANKYRDITISWSRYDYSGEIIEAGTINEILDQALSDDYKWCLILPYGHVIAERWVLDHWQSEDFSAALRDSLEQEDFLVAGPITGDAETWYGFEDQCLLVNLQVYQRLNRPEFDVVCEQPIEVPRVQRRVMQGRLSSLMPSADSEPKQPARLGWHFIAASLRNGVPVVGLDQRLSCGVLDLSAKQPARTAAFANYLNHGIANYDPENSCLGEDQIALLNMIQPQTTSARNGVFLWNIEAYADIETPRDDFHSPINSLYSVAAGFKPNRILHTHGWDSSTRVVYFDYSPRALEIRRYMVEHWDGDDFPDFIDQLFVAFPHPDTFYQLWDGLTPDTVDSSDIREMWQRELRQWGTAAAFRDHWRAYRELKHEYVVCNLLADSSGLFDKLTRESNAMIWWSNAFFTVYGNWFYTLEERQRIYEAWIQQIATLNPELYLFGSDYTNVNVNSVRAGEYWDAYKRASSSCLKPCRLSKTEIRM